MAATATNAEQDLSLHLLGLSFGSDPRDVGLVHGPPCPIDRHANNILATDGTITGTIHHCGDHPGALIAKLRSGVIACFGESVRLTADHLATDVVQHAFNNVIAPLAASRDRLVLHGVVVSKESKAVVLVAPSGTGKSTLAAAAHAAGYDVPSDDCCAVLATNGGCAVAPGAPVITPRRADGTRERIAVDALTKELDLVAICIAHRGTEAALAPHTQGSAAVAIMSNSFVLDHSPASLRAWASRAADLSRTADVHQLTVPEGIERIPEVFVHLDRLLA